MCVCVLPKIQLKNNLMKLILICIYFEDLKFPVLNIDSSVRNKSVMFKSFVIQFFFLLEF